MEKTSWKRVSTQELQVSRLSRKTQDLHHNSNHSSLDLSSNTPFAHHFSEEFGIYDRRGVSYLHRLHSNDLEDVDIDDDQHQDDDANCKYLWDSLPDVDSLWASMPIAPHLPGPYKPSKTPRNGFLKKESMYVVKGNLQARKEKLAGVYAQDSADLQNPQRSQTQFDQSHNHMQDQLPPRPFDTIIGPPEEFEAQLLAGLDSPSSKRSLLSTGTPSSKSINFAESTMNLTGSTMNVSRDLSSQDSVDNGAVDFDALQRAGRLLWPRCFKQQRAYELRKEKESVQHSEESESEKDDDDSDDDDHSRKVSKKPTKAPGAPKGYGKGAGKDTFGASSKTSELGDGQKALLHFKNFCISRFKNILRAWHQLDTDGNMNLGLQEFRRGCERVRYHGNINQLWKYLDRDASGTVTLLEVDADVAAELAAFKGWANETFGPSIEDAFAHLDTNGNRNLSYSEFKEALDNFGFRARTSCKTLFQMLDKDGLGVVTLDEITFLDKWEPPAFLFCEPNEVALQRFKARLCQAYSGNAIRAWCCGLDRDRSMSVCWREFETACNRFLGKGKWKEDKMAEGLKVKSFQDYIAQVWRALDDDLSGWVSIREFDIDAFINLLTFRKWCVANHGSCMKAFNAMDQDHDGEVYVREFREMAMDCDVNLDLLFEGLDFAGDGIWTSRSVKFIDEWDLQWEQQEDLPVSLKDTVNSLANEVQMHNLKRATCAFLRPVKEDKAADEDEVGTGSKKTKGSASRSMGFGRSKNTGRAKRGGIVNTGGFLRENLNIGHRQFKKLKEELIQKFGNPIRGWCELDKKMKMHLTQADLIRALTNAGITSIDLDSRGPAGMMGMSSPIHSLWTYLDRENHGTISFLEFDPQAALEVSEFKTWMLSRAGKKAMGEFQDLAEAGDLKIDFEVLLAICVQKGYKGSLKTLFQMLDEDRDGMCRPSAVPLFENWKPSQYLFESPNESLLEKFKERVSTYFHDEPVKAWCIGMCVNRVMRMCWRDFEVTYLKVSQNQGERGSWKLGMSSGGAKEGKGISAARKLKAEACSVWRTLDKDLKGWVSLRAFDETAFECLLSFKQWAERYHGTIAKAFRFMEEESGGRLDAKGLRKFTAGGEVQNVDMLFFGLDEGKGFLMEQDLTFLEEWDLDWELEEGPLPDFSLSMDFAGITPSIHKAFGDNPFGKIDSAKKKEAHPVFGKMDTLSKPTVGGRKASTFGPQPSTGNRKDFRKQATGGLLGKNQTSKVLNSPLADAFGGAAAGTTPYASPVNSARPTALEKPSEGGFGASPSFNKKGTGEGAGRKQSILGGPLSLGGRKQSILGGPLSLGGSPGGPAAGRKQSILGPGGPAAFGPKSSSRKQSILGGAQTNTQVMDFARRMSSAQNKPSPQMMKRMFEKQSSAHMETMAEEDDEEEEVDTQEDLLDKRKYKKKIGFGDNVSFKEDKKDNKKKMQRQDSAFSRW